MANIRPGAAGDWRSVGIVALGVFVAAAIPLPPRLNLESGPFGVDKLLHAIGHAGLAAVLCKALNEEWTGADTALIAVGVSTLHGIGIECFQEWVPGREFERGDVVAGVIGSMVGVIGVWADMDPSQSPEQCLSGGRTRESS